MNMETAGRPAPEKRDLDEAEPSLPADPAEAAAWLEEVWKGNDGWKSQHHLRSKVEGPEDYQKLSDTERDQYHKLSNQFKWLAEMHRSEMGWSQSYARTNQGEVIGFRFGFEMPKNHEDDVPEAYAYLPFDERQPKVFVSKSSDGWKVTPLDEMLTSYAKLLEY